MACLTSRSSRGWDGAISYARSSRSGCADGPERRRGFSAARSSKSHRRSGRRREPFEDAPPQVPTAVAAEGMWYVGEPALLVDHRDGLLGAVPWRDSAFEVEADHLAISGGDLFADDHLQARVHLTESLTAL